MSRLWDFLRGRIRSAENQKSTLPFLHETVDLKAYPAKEFLEWHNGPQHEALKTLLKNGYRDFLIRSVNDETATDFLQSPSSNGWVLQCQQLSFGVADYRHLMYLIQKRLKEKRYIMNVADIQSRQKANWIEQVYRHYLKPSARMQMSDNAAGQKAQQLFGNITMELISRDDKPYVLKLLAHNYSDQHYAEVDDFSELMELICQ